MVIVLLGLHYATAVWLVVTEPYGDVSFLSDRIRGMESVLAAWTFIYFGGQLFLWVGLVREMRVGGRR